MIPVLYKGDEQSFLHNGLGQLTEATSAIVTEVANGKLELEITYPVSGRLKNSISDHMLIKAKPNSVDEPHVFRIYSHTLDTETQTITISAHSKSNDLGNNLVKNVKISGRTPQQAMNLMKANLVEPTEYNFISDITTTSSTTWTNRNPLNCIAGESGSLVHYWGGEIKRDNDAIYLYRRRGNDKVAVIREGKDLGGVEIEYSTKGMVTKIIPFRTYIPEDDEGDAEEITEYGTPVESPYINNYPIKYIVAVDYSYENGVTDLQTMNTKASRYFTENNGVDKPNINVNVNLVDLSESPEYEKFKSLENKQLFDTFTIYSKKYDINIEAKVNTLVYDSLGEKNISLDMGSYRTGLMESAERTYKDALAERDTRITNIVQRAANGKNRIFRGIDEPSNGMVKNDLWYKPVGAGETMLYRFDGATWKIEKVSAGLLGGTLDAENGDVDLINVNVANIVGETSNFVQSNWNNNLSDVRITASGVITSSVDGSYSRLVSGEVRSYNASGGTSAIMGNGRSQYYIGGNSHLIIGNTLHGSDYIGETSLQIAHTRDFVIGRYDRETHEAGVKLIPYITFDYGSAGNEDTGRIRFRKETHFIDSGLNFRSTTQAIGRIGEVGASQNIGIHADNELLLGVNGGGVYSSPVSIKRTVIAFGVDLDMGGKAILNQSDIRLKTNVVDSQLEALKEIARMRYIEYDWDLKNPANKDKQEGRNFGIVAQYSPFLQTKSGDTESYLSIDLIKYVNLLGKGTQELLKRVEKLEAKL